MLGSTLGIMLGIKLVNLLMLGNMLCKVRTKDLLELRFPPQPLEAAA